MKTMLDCIAFTFIFIALTAPVWLPLTLIRISHAATQNQPPTEAVFSLWSQS